MSELEILCVTGPRHRVITDGLIAIVIDGHNVTLDGERYLYDKDPVYNSVHPNTIIPA